MKECIIEGCDNEISEKSRLDACALCRAAINRWAKKRSALVLKRRLTLQKFNARLEPLVDANVVELKTRRQREEYAEKDLVRITTRLVRSHPRLRRLPHGEERARA